MKRIAILGSTGSIGTQALDVIRQHPSEFEARVLTAGSNWELLVKQAREFHPDAVVIANESHYDAVCEALADLPIKVYTGSDALCQVVASDSIDLVLTAMVGFAGLRPTVVAIQAGKTLALANKETLVVAGRLIRNLCEQYRVGILPVDSEHSAIFQSINGEAHNRVRRILLTASGGPFRHFTVDQLRDVTPAQALQHPNWKMGAKITIDSATMMNKGFEMIEARWLYDVKPRDIQVVVHPESVIHSAVEFDDGAVMAQLGTPDMRLPIQYAFSYPRRLPLNGEPLDLFSLGALHFERPDEERFPCLRLAYEAIERGGNMPCILNAANEVTNLAFREGKISFYDISDFTERAMKQMSFLAEPTLDELFETDAQTRQMVEAYCVRG
ncbi:1-deoxy-D-xylulose-5-phosphate reductoisomerase [gut metagenome]|uniref:1-deoxy-D-xylulose-5-phosphate reductoisomerase n=1 Tax=gut metagenome TaxID=749906 RepID=J9FXZ0_9ZZZZ